jgi:Uma2 family endonuclease
MATVILDREFAAHLREERAVSGADRWDEVWDGTYMMAPLPNNEHQLIASRLAALFQEVVGWNSPVIVQAGANITDREHSWQENYRCPDVVVYFPTNPAVNRVTHWYGGPDLAVEVTSEDDRAREKIPFYAKIGTRELLIVDRDPWQIELFRLASGQLKSVDTIAIGDDRDLMVSCMPLKFQLTSEDSRPSILVTHTVDGRIWNV